MMKTQTYNDGVLNIYSVENIASPGEMPADKITLKESLRYEERTVGMTRFYAAMQNNVNIKYVLRAPRIRAVSTLDVAIPNDGKQYKIVQIQYPQDVEPPSMDLTLEELTPIYDIWQPEAEPEPEVPEEGGGDGEP